MTDLEITRLCAEAMDLPTPEIRGEVVYCGGFTTRGFTGKSEYRAGGMLYHPLHDDAQAMALVKKFCLILHTYTAGEFRGLWRATTKTTEAQSRDLNRAICECVAKLKQGES